MLCTPSIQRLGLAHMGLSYEQSMLDALPHAMNDSRGWQWDSNTITVESSSRSSVYLMFSDQNILALSFATLAHSRIHSRQKLWSQASGEPTACDVRRAKQIGQRGQESSPSPSLSDSSSSVSDIVPVSSVFTLQELVVSVSLVDSDPNNTYSMLVNTNSCMY